MALAPFQKLPNLAPLCAAVLGGWIFGNPRGSWLLLQAAEKLTLLQNTLSATGGRPVHHCELGLVKLYDAVAVCGALQKLDCARRHAIRKVSQLHKVHATHAASTTVVGKLLCCSDDLDHCCFGRRLQRRHALHLYGQVIPLQPVLLAKTC